MTSAGAIPSDLQSTGAAPATRSIKEGRDRHRPNGRQPVYIADRGCVCWQVWGSGEVENGVYSTF
ncbi:hypothetical protein B0T14DRAFT_40233 [Immersiella caudata]|uniref:Uncharacterized protein n=1 Tax=Immersiella caudata TaxID=314043 RepID=A0AA40CC30_9PEZI|nr:hypothetical protein B0T14DRAFT_40233 [Immersiella caudata]